VPLAHFLYSLGLGFVTYFPFWTVLLLCDFVVWFHEFFSVVLVSCLSFWFFYSFSFVSHNLQVTGFLGLRLCSFVFFLLYFAFLLLVCSILCFVPYVTWGHLYLWLAPLLALVSTVGKTLPGGGCGSRSPLSSGLFILVKIPASKKKKKCQS